MSRAEIYQLLLELRRQSDSDLADLGEAELRQTVELLKSYREVAGRAERAEADLLAQRLLALLSDMPQTP